VTGVTGKEVAFNGGIRIHTPGVYLFIWKTKTEGEGPSTPSESATLNISRKDGEYSSLNGPSGGLPGCLLACREGLNMSNVRLWLLLFDPAPLREE
jgi:hypothetical protein